MSIRAELEEEILSLKEKLACCCCGKGIAYMDIQHTVTTSYIDGDEGYRLVNGLFNLNNPERPEYYQNLDYTVSDPHFTLKYNNVFGTKDRFTDQDGLQVYGDDIVVDHLHKRMYTDASETGVALNWGDTIDLATASTHGGYSDWYLVTQAELESVIKHHINNASIGPISPFVLFFGNPEFTSTTLASDSNRIFAAFSSFFRLFTGVTKSGSTTAHSVRVRIFNESELV